MGEDFEKHSLAQGIEEVRTIFEQAHDLSDPEVMQQVCSVWADHLSSCGMLESSERSHFIASLFDHMCSKFMKRVL